MIRLAASQLMSPRTPFEEDILMLRDQGYEGVGIWRGKLLEYGVEKGIELLRETGIQVSSLQWAGGFTGDEILRYDECIADACEAIELAAQLQADCLLVYSGSRAGHTRKHCQRLFQEALSRLVPFAEEHGVVLGLEPMHPAAGRQWSIADSLPDTLGWVEQIDSPYLQLIFDTYHICGDATWPQWLEDYRDRIALVHLADAKDPPSFEQNRCLLGAGHVPLSEFLSKLDDLGYQGFVEIELFGEELDVMPWEDLLRHSRQVVDDLGQVVN